MATRQLNLPNIITIGRIAACPLIAWMALAGDQGLRYFAFPLFLAASLSDLWDGYLARKHGQITDVGKLLDPIADKLLLVSTLIPFYLISHRGGVLDAVPFLGPLPLWIVGVIFGREIVVTVFRHWAARQGVVISAAKAGKYKAFTQNLFIGGLLFWYPLVRTASDRGWTDGPVWGVWTVIHTGWIGITLLVALILTVYSMLDYFWSHRSLMGGTT